MFKAAKIIAFSRPSAERGAATLLVTLMIVLAMGILTFTMSQTTALENRITAGDLRGKEAFHAAQSGLDFALGTVADGRLRDLLIEPDPSNECPRRDLSGQREGANVTLSGPTFELRFGADDPRCDSNFIPLLSRIPVRSIGRSADGAAVRVLDVAIEARPVWDNSAVTEIERGRAWRPAIVGRDWVEIKGTPNPAACPSTERCVEDATSGNKKMPVDDSVLVWSGTRVGSEDGKYQGFTGSSPLSEDNLVDLTRPGDDEFTGMPSDADEFFSWFFSDPDGTQIGWEDFKAGATFVESGGELPDQEGLNQNPTIWVDGDFRFPANSVLGSPANPVTIVVDGNLTLGANTIIYGVVYLRSDGNTPRTADGRGTAKIVGTLASESPLDLAGNFSVWSDEAFSRPGSRLATGEIETGVVGTEVFLSPDSWRELRVGNTRGTGS